MNSFKHKMPGFSLIELMVAIAVLAIILMIAVPSFNELRERSALRGASDQVISFWNEARFEALKRNKLIKVAMVNNGNGGYCIGAATTDERADNDACDCFSVSDCDVARYPGSQSEWKGVRYFGDPADFNSNEGVAVIDPKRAGLALPSQFGAWTMESSAGGPDYRLNVNIDRFGRALACEPEDASIDKMPQFTRRRCQ